MTASLPPAVELAPPPQAARPAPPYVVRLGVLLAGLCCFALGDVLTFKSRLGLGPWDCFHQGLSLHSPLTIGQASIVTGAAVILLSLLLGVRPGVGTFGNMLFVGLFFDAWNFLLPDPVQPGLLWQLVIDGAGVLILGLGSGIYIKARLGAGPRDSLMLALTRRSGWRVAVVRGLVELSALTFGFLLGGVVGPGTLIFAFGVGPAVELGFRLLRIEAGHA